MALRVIHTQGLPLGHYIVDPTAEFLPGMLAGFQEYNRQTLVTVANGSSIMPIGLIDDIKTNSILKGYTQREVILNISSDDIGQDFTGNLILTSDVYGFLEPNILPESFATDIPAVTLKAENGVIIVPAGTALNHDSDGDGVNDSIKLNCRYRYKVANIIGDDSTVASGKITIWYTRGVYMTDQYDVMAPYDVQMPLYCSPNGLLTTSENGIIVGSVITPPRSIYNWLEFLLY